ncbi:MAG: YraN family protein [Solirubrobacterales bacterium]|nr:YraN family protein [Solirubrobacterales bacterium]
MDRRSLGTLGEELALAHLHARGFQTVARNHRTRHGEIDLIVFNGVALVFVEVKTRCVARFAGTRPGGIAEPLESIGPHKRARLRRLASAWLAETDDRPNARELRFDAIGVRVDRRGELVALEHLPGAF